MFNVPDTKYVMQVLAPAITFVSASAVFRGYFAGLDDMKPTSYSQIIEQFFKLCIINSFCVCFIRQKSHILWQQVETYQLHYLYY